MSEQEKLEVQLIDARRRVLELELEVKRLNGLQTQLVKRLCDAMGEWSGPWEDAAVARLIAARKRASPGAP